MNNKKKGESRVLGNSFPTKGIPPPGGPFSFPSLLSRS
jgi:hypothetical protein